MTGQTGERTLLIEHYLPIDAISAEAKQESSVTQAKGKLSKALLTLLHRWWARRPLVAVRGAVYGALVNVRDDTAQREKDFVKDLCRWKAPKALFDAARTRVLEAAGSGPPRVLDMFAGGGSIPLEAARLGCEAHATELNPVAHFVQLVTLVYPATHGRALLDEVRVWSKTVRDRAHAQVGDLYPARLVSSPSARAENRILPGLAGEGQGTAVPIVYFWTRTVPCPRPGCDATVPLQRQTWLRKKVGAFEAVRPVAEAGEKHVKYELLQSRATDAKTAVREWGFDPDDLSKAGESVCIFCNAPVGADHIKDSGRSGRIGRQLVAVGYTRQGQRGKTYEAAGRGILGDSVDVTNRLERVAQQMGIQRGETPLPPRGALGFRVQAYGFSSWDDLFTSRQLLSLLALAKGIREAHAEMTAAGTDPDFARAVAAYLACILDRVAERNWTITHWDPQGEFVQVDIGSGRLPMNWDFPEVNPFGSSSGSWRQASEDVLSAVEALVIEQFSPCVVQRVSASSLPYANGFFDAIVTDPPYYDNVPYSYLADFYFAWLKRSVGHLFPEHFASVSSPVKAEAVMDPSRHAGDKRAASLAYERSMAAAFGEAHRVLKSDGPMICVYAHKTTAGWATLVDALRRAGFTVTEAWPLDTENPSRQRSKDSAALSSSIFLVTRRREADAFGSYEVEVRPLLAAIVAQRVGELWDLGISGADLVIACVGAGLRAFTRFSKVTYENGEEVPAERFLAEVETVVLEAILDRLSRQAGGDGRTSLEGLDPATRCYTLWRYTYRGAELDAGEAIIFANGTHVELDGPAGLSTGPRSLVEKKKGKYRLREYSERGEDERLGLPLDGQLAPLIDALHRTLWLMENQPTDLPEFLAEAQPNREQMRLVAQVLAGPALKGGELTGPSPTGELAALAKLTANWRSVVEDAATTAQEREAIRAGQKRLGFDERGRR